MRSLRASVVGLTAVVVGVSVAAGAWAADLIPPLKGMKERTTNDGVLRIELPDNTEEGAPESLPGAMGGWTTWVQAPKPGQNPDMKFDVTWEMPYGRMALARYMLDRWRPGVVPDGGLSAGPGYVEERRTAADQGLECVNRYFENDGTVIVVRVLLGDQIYPHVKGHISAMLDTVKVLKRPEDKPLPFVAGALSIDGCEVLTDADKKTATTFVKIHARGLNAMRSVLPGEPFDKSPPRVIICARSIEYDDIAVGEARKNKTPWAYNHSYRRAAVINADGWKKSRDDAEQEVEYIAMIQALQAYFGGLTPDWLEIGLGQYVDAGLDAGGKPKKPKKPRIKLGREAFLAADRPLDVLFSVRAPADLDGRWGFYYEAWTWHFFLRHGTGAKKYGPTYLRHLAALRETGDPLEARKVWDGVDFAAMHAQAKKWAEKWR